MDRPTPRQLEAFDAIARTGSVAAAARDLGLTRDAVDEAVRTLESNLGVALFAPGEGDDLHLSAHGEAALPGALRILAESDALLAAVESVPGGGASIVMGTHPSIFALLKQELAAFEDEFPDRPLSMDFDCFIVEQVALAFSEGRTDLALFYALGETRSFVSHKLWNEGWSLFVGRSHPLASRQVVRLEDIAQEALLLSSPTNRLRLLLDTCLVQGGLGNLQVAAELEDHARLVQRCRAGEGILPLFGPTAAQTAVMPGIRRLAYAGRIPAIEVRCAVRPKAEADESVQALAEIIRRGTESI